MRPTRTPPRKPHRTNRWWTDGPEGVYLWECDEYDHGPFCRLCRCIGPLKKEVAG